MWCLITQSSLSLQNLTYTLNYRNVKASLLDGLFQIDLFSLTTIDQACVTTVENMHCQEHHGANDLELPLVCNWCPPSPIPAGSSHGALLLVPGFLAFIPAPAPGPSAHSTSLAGFHLQCPSPGKPSLTTRMGLTPPPLSQLPAPCALPSQHFPGFVTEGLVFN